MKRTLVLLPVFAIGAAAQDNGGEQLKVQVGQLAARSAATVMVKSAVMGPTVKGAPYSALETVENTQTLADGTHINRTTQTMVYRDSEGRMRRETPDSVTIWDPVANASYALDPKTQTARTMPLGLAAAGPIINAQSGPNGQVMRFEYRTGGASTSGVLPVPSPPSVPLPEAGNMVFLASGLAPGSPPMLFNLQGKMTAKTDSLGQQTIEGLNTEGTRITSTIEAGEIGNDRPIQIVTERWYSNDLGTNIKMTHSDPRTGQETLELTGISRVEPSPDLFQMPANYQIVGGK
jgi:hypothetical protein